MAVENQIDENTLKSLYSINSTYSDKFYITKQEDIFRLTFCELVPGDKRISVISSFTLTKSNIIELGELIGLMTK